MSKSHHIAVLGSGIMGSSTALFLARNNVQVTLFDGAKEPFSEASRWNEGKIHLGFIYSADPSLRTLYRVLPGGLVFKPLVENLIGCSLDSVTTLSDDIYLCHKDSVVSPGAMWDYYQKVAKEIRQHPNAGQYLVDASKCPIERIVTNELHSITDSPSIIEGYRVPEHSVMTNWVADRFVEALSAEPLIEHSMNTRVTAVFPKNKSDIDGVWYVKTSDGVYGPYDYIINALWEGRIAIDLTAGLNPEGIWSNRYRLSLFVRTSESIDVPSAIIATGPFGDIKNYNNQNFYLSWYPLGLITDSSAISPPNPSMLDSSAKKELSGAILDKLGELLPKTKDIRERIEQIELRGGWVFAAGQGKLSDPESTLHCRSGFGIERRGRYISVDTGKYSTAPWLAKEVVDMICAA